MRSQMLPLAGVLGLTACVAADPSNESTRDSTSTGSDIPSAATTGDPGVVSLGGSTGTTGGSTSLDSETGVGTTAESGSEESSTGSVAPANPVFLATGDMGRSTISCDLGRTWIQERSFDLEPEHPFLCATPGPVECGVSPCSALRRDGTCEDNDTCDCLHHPGAGIGGVVTDLGTAVAAWGWFDPGPVRRSRDGVSWTTVFEEPRGSLGGLAYGNDTLVAGTRPSGNNPLVQTSFDDGLTWTEQSVPLITATVRDAEFVDVMGGRFVIYTDDGIVLSPDGLSWQVPQEQPSECFGNLRSVLGGNDTMVLLGSQDNACTSLDGGLTWAVQPLGVSGQGAWNGSSFFSWDSGMTYTSHDGLEWTAVDTSDQPRPWTARGDTQTGVIVAVSGSSYAQQVFLRSEDGLSWESLPASAFEASHRISNIAVGPDTTLCSR